MGTIILAGTAVLVVFGFGDHIWWLAAITLLFLYARYGRGSSSASAPGPPAAPGSATSYRQYRERRDQQAKWERRYSRERRN
jgi:hypothetical protein